ncbi:hypothetical protein [Singulisphaera sp. GP187]|nr:hypothetical protein [Singulisphaera sp. GP187]
MAEPFGASAATVEEILSPRVVVLTLLFGGCLIGLFALFNALL